MTQHAPIDLTVRRRPGGHELRCRPGVRPKPHRRTSHHQAAPYGQPGSIAYTAIAIGLSKPIDSVTTSVAAPGATPAIQAARRRRGRPRARNRMLRALPGICALARPAGTNRPNRHIGDRLKCPAATAPGSAAVIAIMDADDAAL